MDPRRCSALDLGSGTIKWSVFERRGGVWLPLVLDEVNTELRKGMGEERTLKPGPLADTLNACRDFLSRARAMGLPDPPAYATSAVRKAANPEALLDPLRAMGVTASILGWEDEGRLNLLGLQARLRSSAVPAQRPLVMDPGGDSTEICADLDTAGWERARVASLPFGSVSLQEEFGSSRDNEPLAWTLMEEVAGRAARVLRTFPDAFPFAGAGLLPAIRMNLPIQRALERINGLPAAGHGEGGTYALHALEALCRETASRDHAGRAALMAGEPMGKVDRTCYGFASWLGILRSLEADRFLVEPWGIKLGAALALNPPSTTGTHG